MGGGVWFPAIAHVTCTGESVKIYSTVSGPELPDLIIIPLFHWLIGGVNTVTKRQNNTVAVNTTYIALHVLLSLTNV